MNQGLNNFPSFGTQGIHHHERKARIAGEYRRRHPLNTTHTMSGMGRSSLIILKLIVRGTPLI